MNTVLKRKMEGFTVRQTSSATFFYYNVSWKDSRDPKLADSIQKNSPYFIATELTVKANRNHVRSYFSHCKTSKEISLKWFTCMWQELLAQELQIIQHALHINQHQLTTTKVWEAQAKRKPDEMIQSFRTEEGDISFPVDYLGDFALGSCICYFHQQWKSLSILPSLWQPRAGSFDNSIYMSQASSSKKGRCYCKNRSFQLEVITCLVRIVHKEDLVFKQSFSITYKKSGRGSIAACKAF